MEGAVLKGILTNLGLDELEADCYISLLEKSPQRASDISKRLYVPKATVLEALKDLSNNFGIVKQTRKRNAFLFSVEDVKDLANFVDRRKETLVKQQAVVENLLPELRSMQNFDATKPKIYYYEGKAGLRQAFEHVLQEADEIIGYGSNEDDQKYLPSLFPEYYEDRVKKKIPVKAIVPALPFNIQEALNNEIKHLRTTHLIPEKFNYPIQYNVYKHTAVFYSFEENFALVIKSKPIAQCLQMISELAFDKAGELDKQIRQGNKSYSS